LIIYFAISIYYAIILNMNPATAILPDTPDSLKEIIIALQGEIVELRARHDKETSFLHEQIQLLRAQLFGRKSEKYIPTDGPQLLPLFDMPEPADDEDENAEKIHVPGHTRKKHGRKPLPEELPRVEEVHDIDNKICACGCELKRIGEKKSPSSLISSRHKFRLSVIYVPSMPVRPVKELKMTVPQLR